jgi:uncharacterized membrane protein YwzB
MYLFCKLTFDNQGLVLLLLAWYNLQDYSTIEMHKNNISYATTKKMIFIFKFSILSYSFNNFYTPYVHWSTYKWFTNYANELYLLITIAYRTLGLYNKQWWSTSMIQMSLFCVLKR